MKSLGVIETQGLVTAIQIVDAVCKAAGVSCIGYRKPGAGLVSVYFEGEISAVKTAIERGMEVARMYQKEATSLVIARPERCIVEALSMLKGEPATAQKTQPGPKSLTLPAPDNGELKAPLKKGKKE